MRRIWTAPAIFPMFLAAGGAGASAQSEVDQIGSSAGEAVSIGQISPPSPTVEAESIPRAPAGAGEGQLVDRRESRGSMSQLTRDPGTAPPIQLYRGGPTAQPTEALSRPVEGRTASVVRVEGQDHCDPAAAEEEAPPVCTVVIETRAAEFVRPRDVISAEQQLLIDQRLRDEDFTAEAAARRLATRGGDPDALEDQEIASVVLGEPPPPPGPGEVAAEDRSSPPIEAIVGAILAPPQ